MDELEVLETVKKLVHFKQDAEYISKAFIAYYADTDKYDDKFSLAINIVLFIKRYDKIGVSCSLPFDVLHILLYDETLLSLGQNVKMSDTRRNVVKYEQASIKDLRENFLGNNNISQEEMNAIQSAHRITENLSLEQVKARLNAIQSARDGITENLSLMEIQARKNIINVYVAVPLKKVWTQYFFNIFKNKGEQWVKDNVHDLISDINFHTILPCPSYLNYLHQSLRSVASSDNKKKKKEKELQEGLTTLAAPDADTQNFVSIKNTSTDVMTDVMKDIHTYMSTIMSKLDESKELNSIYFKIPLVIHTLVRWIIQKEAHIYDFGRGEIGKSKKDDWVYVSTSPTKLNEIIVTLRKCNKLTQNGYTDEAKTILSNTLSPLLSKVRRLEYDAWLILLQNCQTFSAHTKLFTTNKLVELVNFYKDELVIETDEKTNTKHQYNVIEKYLYDNITSNEEFCCFLSEKFIDHKEQIKKKIVAILYKHIRVFVKDKLKELSKSGDALASTHRISMNNFIAPGSNKE